MLTMLQGLEVTQCSDSFFSYRRLELLVVLVTTSVAAQTAPSTSQQQATQQPPQTQTVPTRADILRGAYGPYRANNDLLFYHLDVRVDPEKRFISGKNTIRCKVQ